MLQRTSNEIRFRWGTFVEYGHVGHPFGNGSANLGAVELLLLLRVGMKSEKGYRGTRALEKHDNTT